MDTQLLPLQPADQLNRVQDVAALTHVSEASIENWLAQGKFLKSKTLSRKANSQKRKRLSESNLSSQQKEVCLIGTQLIPPEHPDQLLRINDVAVLTTLSKSCINLWVSQKRFPEPVALSSTIKVWKLSQIQSWIDAQFSSGVTA